MLSGRAMAAMDVSFSSSFEAEFSSILDSCENDNAADYDECASDGSGATLSASSSTSLLAATRPVRSCRLERRQAYSRFPPNSMRTEESSSHCQAKPLGPPVEVVDGASPYRTSGVDRAVGSSIPRCDTQQPTATNPGSAVAFCQYAGDPVANNDEQVRVSRHGNLVNECVISY